MDVVRRIFAALCYATAGFAAIHGFLIGYTMLSDLLYGPIGPGLPEPNIWLVAGMYFLLLPLLAVLTLQEQLPGTRPKRWPTASFEVVARENNARAPVDL